MDKIIRNGWQQGSCLSISQDNILHKQQIIKNLGLHIVISQSCDISHDNLQEEPYIELLYATEIRSMEGNYQNGKNPRKMHFEIKVDNKNNFYECLMTNRILLPREYLIDLTPEKTYIIESKVLSNLIDWIIKRYNRFAAPFEFNKRTKETRENIKKILKNANKNILGLFIKLNTNEELNPTEDYIMELHIFSESGISKETRLDISDTLENIVTYLKNTAGIKIKENYRVLGLDEIYVSEYLEFKKWDYDYLSFRKESSGNTLNL